MKKIAIIAAALLLSTVFNFASAQGQPSGTAVYALPRTTISVTIEATVETVTPGPYARFAQKYFGTSAPQSTVSSCRINSIRVQPFIEADPAARYTTVVPEKGSGLTAYMALCSQGLIAACEGAGMHETAFRFPTQAGAEQFIGKEPSNLANVTTTLYKTVRNENGEFDKVAVQQNQTVEKSVEKKAEEAANMIFMLREKRVQIVTGDTDATFSGESLQAAINEISRLEEQYLSLFFGAKTVYTQVKSFDVVPNSSAKQAITVCRISDEGLVAAASGAGRAVTMEISSEALNAPAAAQGKGRENITVYYRVPAIAVCKISDSGKLLTESRIPIYQIGEKLSMQL